MTETQKVISARVAATLTLIRNDRESNGLKPLAPDVQAAVERFYRNYWTRHFIVVRLMDALQLSATDAVVMLKRLAKRGISLELTR
jgi:hypothetical protein